ncbi:MAG: winged helix-turn-helix transcriptional regulator [Thaumarchaeota archaeon]|nr:winged helix-turn-helix transcriptional regulator [Nitrososphaerota archaeon]
MSDTFDESKPSETIEILSTDDDKIKLLGELLSSDSSLKIFNLLCEKELAASEIANNTEMSLELVRHHIQKMQKIGLVYVSKIQKNSREQDMKYYASKKFVIMVVSPTLSDKAKKSKTLFKNLKKVYYFAALGVTAISTWFVTKFFTVLFAAPSISLDRSMSEHDLISGIFWPLIATLSLIIIGLIIARIKKF